MPDLTRGSQPAAAAEAEQMERLGRELETGSTGQRLSALRRLIVARAEGILTTCLASAEPAVVELAIAGLWECWFDEAGPDSRRMLESGESALDEGDLDAAATAFRRLTEAHPGWAEPVNKLATVLYLQGRPRESMDWCRRVLALKPDHFGAWNGLAICAMQIEDWPAAREAVDQSLRLQPHSEINRQLQMLVQSRLAPG